LSCTRFIPPKICSGQVIAPGEDGVPAFDREKCVHCGACLWNCTQANPENPERMNIAFRAGMAACTRQRMNYQGRIFVELKKHLGMILPS
jgi:Fe-S-cluster-containing dehydrogenase component